VFAQGCGDKKKTGATLTGPITLDGKPVLIGTVHVVGADGKEAMGGAEDGKYTVENAPLGSVKVFVTFPDFSMMQGGNVPGPPKDVDTKDMMKDQRQKFIDSYPDMSKMKDKHQPKEASQLSEENVKKAQERMKSVEGLPEKYTKSDQTPFQANIEKGENTLEMKMRRQ
jgi:hypothetical protein